MERRLCLARTRQRIRWRFQGQRRRNLGNCQIPAGVGGHQTRLPRHRGQRQARRRPGEQLVQARRKDVRGPDRLHLPHQRPGEDDRRLDHRRHRAGEERRRELKATTKGPAGVSRRAFCCTIVTEGRPASTDIPHMAVCKTCGCAIPIGSKTCDMCAAVGAVAPAQQVWTAPKQAAAPRELSSSAASWAAAGTGRPAPPADLKKAEKKVREAWQLIAASGVLNIGVGILAEAANITVLLNYFDWFSVGVGVVFLALAYFIRGGSMVAMGITIGLYALDTFLLFWTGHFAIFRIIVLVFLVQALGSLNLLRQQRRVAAQQQPTGPDQMRVA